MLTPTRGDDKPDLFSVALDLMGMILGILLIIQAFRSDLSRFYQIGLAGFFAMAMLELLVGDLIKRFRSKL